MTHALKIFQDDLYAMNRRWHREDYFDHQAEHCRAGAIISCYVATVCPTLKPALLRTTQTTHHLHPGLKLTV